MLVYINKPGTNQHASASLLGRLLQKRNVSLQMLSSAWERERERWAVWGQTDVNRDRDKKWAEWGKKKDKTRGGIKGSAMMQSNAHLSSVGGNDQQPCNYTVISDRGTERRGFCGLFTELNGDKPVFKFDTQNCSWISGSKWKGETQERF